MSRRQVIKKQKRFHKVNIEISNICNLQCSFCPEVIRDKQLMSLEMFRQIIEQVAPLTDQVCFHLMGDPLVHPNLAELLDICHEFLVQVFFVTNGVLLREKQAKLLLHPALRQVNFSLHSFHDNFGDRDPTHYLERVFEYTETAFKLRPDLYINYRLWNLFEPQLTNAKGMGKHNLSLLRRIEERFGFKVRDELNLRKQKSQKITNLLYLHFDTEFIWPSLDLPILGEVGRCYGLSSHFGILVDGTVVPCCLDKEGSIPLGNIKDRLIVDILSSERSQKILKGFQARRLTEELCKRCQYIERFSGGL